MNTALDATEAAVEADRVAMEEDSNIETLSLPTDSTTKRMINRKGVCTGAKEDHDDLRSEILYWVLYPSPQVPTCTSIQTTVQYIQYIHIHNM